jgi:hypothetical protein
MLGDRASINWYLTSLRLRRQRVLRIENMGALSLERLTIAHTHVPLPSAVEELKPWLRSKVPVSFDLQTS